ncbi:LppP/LprE family lipoprotein [Micrococcales bacterium 31B]|nr:LppP/LprE family lipoprotein [Micrococcales bacterium 31B]
MFSLHRAPRAIQRSVRLSTVAFAASALVLTGCASQTAQPHAAARSDAGAPGAGDFLRSAATTQTGPVTIEPAIVASGLTTDTATCTDKTGDQAYQEALAALPAGTHPWAPTPAPEAIAHFDPCLDLSYVIVETEGGTGSSPSHVALFHRGEYIGTATRDAYGYDLKVTQLTSGAVQIDRGYRSWGPDAPVVQFRTKATVTWYDDVNKAFIFGQVPPLEPDATGPMYVNGEIGVAPEAQPGDGQVPLEPSCYPLGVDEAYATAVRDIASEYPWDDAPPADVLATYDPCAALSYIVLHTKGGTASSPQQLAVFHYGVYQGPATQDPYGYFITVDRVSETQLKMTRHWYVGATAGEHHEATALITWDDATNAAYIYGDYPPADSESVTPDRIDGRIGSAPVSGGGETPAPGTCGTADALEAYRTAVEQTLDVRGYPWRADPNVASVADYDPCAPLSWVVLDVDEVTPWSPRHIAVFRYGEFVGTATAAAYTSDARVERVSPGLLRVVRGWQADVDGDGNPDETRYATMHVALDTDNSVWVTGEVPPDEPGSPNPYYVDGPLGSEATKTSPFPGRGENPASTLGC